MQKTQVIRIFSRDSEESYRWLINFLLTLFGVGDVRPVYITPNSARHFRDELSKCSFAVLYRGSLNLTDVADSLYDRELEALYARLGRDNVIVVVDDMIDGSNEKAMILNTQPKLGRLARNLFLFSTEEKQKSLPFTATKLEEIRMIDNSHKTECALKYCLMWVIAAVIVFVIILSISLISGCQQSESGVTSDPGTLRLGSGASDPSVMRGDTIITGR